MVSEHSVEENPTPQQSEKAAQGEQQASDSNQYICITAIGVVWSSAWNKNLHFLLTKTQDARYVLQ